MQKKYEITREKAEEIAICRKQIKDKNTDRRMHAVQMCGEGFKYREIAAKLDCKIQQVGRWVKLYAEGGLERLNPKVGGRRHEKMTLEQETEFLEQFKAKAEKGMIVEVKEIKEAYEKITGPCKSNSQIYNVLHRHGWRKIMPRSKHPKKASEEVIEASKKLKNE